MNEKKPTDAQMEVVRALFFSGVETMIYALRMHVQGAPSVLSGELEKVRLPQMIGELERAVREVSYNAQDKLKKRVGLD